MSPQYDDGAGLSGSREREADLLLSGRARPEDVDPDYAVVASLLSMVRPGPAAPTGQPPPAALAAIRASITGPATTTAGTASQRRRTRPTRRATAVAVSVATVLSGGVAAAATGSLPSPAQDAVASALAHVGVSIPRPGPATTAPNGGGRLKDAGSASPSPGAPGSSSVAGTADIHGLCTAYLAGGDPQSPMFRALLAGHGDDPLAARAYCSSVIGPGETAAPTPGAAPGRNGNGPPADPPATGGFGVNPTPASTPPGAGSGRSNAPSPTPTGQAHSPDQPAMPHAVPSHP